MNHKESKGIVLVVDDSADALGIINALLVKDGYTVSIAMDGVQALAIADRLTPDIVLMDAIMPNMDGFEACIALKNSRALSEVPVIFMTGLSESEDVIRGLEAGGVDYINKPIKLDELLARIKVHLNNSRKTRSAQVALDEVGQSALACDINGRVVWSTDYASALLESARDDNKGLSMQLPSKIKSWLSNSPQRNDTIQLQGTDKLLHLKFLGRSSPGEYLLKLHDSNEEIARAALKQHFELTEREVDVLLWLARGKTNREIAQILALSPRTINKHLEPVYRKMAVQNRTAAATICLQYMGNR
jgi:DNA-binding NarL/FixJ family response regulator